MTTESASVSTYLLIDSAMLPNELRLQLADASLRPVWMHPIYKPEAESVSPYVIDILAAYFAGDLASVMSLANAVLPQLHASFIDSTLAHAEITQRLRHFIMVRNHAGLGLTLRFADSTALVTMAAVFTPPQWRAITSHITRWLVHDRDGTLLTLPLSDPQIAPSPTPLVLAAYQIEAMHEWSAPSNMVAVIEGMQPGEEVSDSVAERHRWASEARSRWWQAPHADALVLRWLTMAVLDTRGEALSVPTLNAILANTDPAAIRAGLREIVAQYRSDPSNTVAETSWDS